MPLIYGIPRAMVPTGKRVGPGTAAPNQKAEATHVPWRRWTPTGHAAPSGRRGRSFFQTWDHTCPPRRHPMLLLPGAQRTAPAFPMWGRWETPSRLNKHAKAATGQQAQRIPPGAKCTKAGHTPSRETGRC